MVYMYHSFLVHSSADGHLGCFHVLAMINSAAMNTGVHVSLSDLVSLVCMPRSGIAGSYGSSIPSWHLGFLGNFLSFQCEMLALFFFNPMQTRQNLPVGWIFPEYSRKILWSPPSLAFEIGQNNLYIIIYQHFFFLKEEKKSAFWN